MRNWWGNLPDSSKRAIKTLWQTFLGTFLTVFFMGLTEGLVDVDAMKALAISAVSAAIAATSSKVVNYLAHEWDTDGIYEEDL